jgi:uncharacterized protein
MDGIRSARWRSAGSSACWRHPVVLAHLYCAGRHSILLVAAWHTAFNFTSATEGTGALVGSIMSVGVIGWAIWVLRRTESAGRQPAG